MQQTPQQCDLTGRLVTEVCSLQLTSCLMSELHTDCGHHLLHFLQVNVVEMSSAAAAFSADHLPPDLCSAPLIVPHAVGMQP